MAKVSYTDPNLAEIRGLYNVARIADRFSFSRVCKKRTFMTPDQIQKIKDRSYLKDIATIWQTYTPGQKAAWKAVDTRSRKNGWQVFVKDQSLRYKANLAGSATPNQYHQASVGTINSDAVVGEYKIRQQHPNTYYVQRKRKGSKSMYDAVEIREDIYLPFQIGLNYKVVIDELGSDPKAQFFAKVISHYQGRDIENIILIDLQFGENWQYATESLNACIGVVRSYELFFYLKNIKGNIFFDNIQAVHNAQNWCRDWQCDNIEQNYTKSWQQIAKAWEIVIDSPNAYHASGYLDE